MQFSGYKFSFQEGWKEHELWSQMELGLICAILHTLFPCSPVHLSKGNNGVNLSGLLWFTRPCVYSMLADIPPLRVPPLFLYLKGNYSKKGTCNGAMLASPEMPRPWASILASKVYALNTALKDQNLFSWTVRGLEKTEHESCGVFQTSCWRYWREIIGALG